MNETRITVHGNVVSEPVPREGRNGTVFTTFRMATTPFRRTPDGKYLDGETSFYSVIAFGALAANTASSLRKGQPIIVEGNLSTKTYLSGDGTTRQSSEIEATHVGHDLTWGRASFQRMSKAAALGYDRTSDVDVRAALDRLNREGEQAGGREGDFEPAGRPANVDANGEIHEAPVSDVAGMAAIGDPETDPYTVDEPAA